MDRRPFAQQTAVMIDTRHARVTAGGDVFTEAGVIATDPGGVYAEFEIAH